MYIYIYKLEYKCVCVCIHIFFSYSYWTFFFLFLLDSLHKMGEREKEEKETYFQKLAHANVGASNSEIHRESQYAGNSSKSWCCRLEYKICGPGQ